MSLLEIKKVRIFPFIFFLLSLVNIVSGSDEENMDSDFEHIPHSRKIHPKKREKSERNRLYENNELNVEPLIAQLMTEIQALKKQITDNKILNDRKTASLERELLMLTGNSPTYKRLIRLDAPLYISLVFGTTVYGAYIWNGTYDPTTFMNAVYGAYFFLTMLMRYATVINRP